MTLVSDGFVLLSINSLNDGLWSDDGLWSNENVLLWLARELVRFASAVADILFARVD